jgi:uncharacterized membrane protein
MSLALFIRKLNVQCATGGIALAWLSTVELVDISSVWASFLRTFFTLLASTIFGTDLTSIFLT